MDDKRLEYLLKLAIEAEDFERAASNPPLRLVGSSRQPRRWLLPVAGLMSAAAAAVAVLTVVVPSISPATRPSNALSNSNRRVFTHELAQVPTGDFDKPLVNATSNSEESSVVLAIFEGLDGRCSCVHIQDEEWNGEQLASKDRGELLEVALSSRCAAPAPKILVVAIAGQRGDMPRLQEEAQAIAARLSNHASWGDPTEMAYQAMSALPPGTKVVAESFGNRNTILDHAKWALR